MKKLLLISIIIISFLSLIWLSFALDVPAIDGYVLDQTSSITSEQEQILESKIQEFQQSTDTEIWILIIDSLEWEDKFNYSLKVAEERWIWDKEKDNWLLMFFAMKDKKRQIQVWYGLEWIITDNISKRLWEKNIPNNFRAWLYFDWINNTLDDIINYIKKDPETLEYINWTDNSNNARWPLIPNSWELNLFFFFFIVMIIKWLVVNYDKKKKKNKIKKNWRLYFALIWIISSVLIYILFATTILETLLIWYWVNLIALWLVFLFWWKTWWWSSSGWSTGGSILWWLWWFSSGWSGSWSSFWGFWWWSFGGGGWWWDR